MTRALIAACLAVISVASPGRAHDTFFECLSQFAFGQSLGVGGVCQPGPGCSFRMRVCFNEPVPVPPPEQPSCVPGAIERVKIRATGNCKDGVAQLRATAVPLGDAATCGPSVPILVEHGRCVIHLKSRSTDGRKDVKRLYLDCPPPGGKCGCVPGPGRPCPHP